MRTSRTKNFILILIWGLVGCVALYFLYSAIQNGGINFEPHYQGEPAFTLNDVTLDDHIDSIAIDWISGGVKIIATTGDQIRIVEKAYKPIDKAKEVKVTVSGSVLELKSRNKTIFNFLGLLSTQTYLEVYLPITTSFNRISLAGVSGNYTIDDVYADLSQINLTSGNLALNNSYSGLLSLTMTSGRATITDSEILSANIQMTSGQLNYSAKTNNFKSKMTSGQVNLDLLETLPATFSLQMTSGSANLTLHKAEPFSFSVEKTSGNFNPQFEVSKNGNIYAYKSGGPVYTINMTSGNIGVKLSSN